MHSPIFRLLCLLSLLFPVYALYGQASDLEISSSVAEAHGCDAQCLSAFNQGRLYDLNIIGKDFDYDFYATPPEFFNSTPGDILKLEKVVDSFPCLNVANGSVIYRFMYTSRNYFKANFPVTGFIAFPNVAIDTHGKFQTVAVMHGTLGIYRGCAPSSSPTLYDYGIASGLVASGYAVVATDYAGLGNNFTSHKYLTFPDHANDAFFGYQAAKKAFGNAIGDDWLSMGHSQGGGAAWKLAESGLLKKNGSGNYLGTVALAPATRLYNMSVLAQNDILTLPNASAYSIFGEILLEQTARYWINLVKLRKYANYHNHVLIPLLGPAVKRFLPKTNLGKLYAAKMLQRLELIALSQSCAVGSAAMTVGLSVEDILAGEIEDVPEIQDRFNRVPLNSTKCEFNLHAQVEDWW